jgi:hypothetical protein
MKPASDKPGQRDGPSRLIPESDTPSEANRNGWATATRRVLLYLKALGVPPRDSLYLAQEALECAEREPGSSPVQSALVSLRSLLCSRGLCAGGFQAGWPAGPVSDSRSPMAVPPLRPSQMTPARIDRRPWLTFLLRCARRCVSFFRKGRTEREAARQSAIKTGARDPAIEQERRRAS